MTQTSESIEGVKPYRILCLDGGGAKGFYTLGVLREIEGLVKQPLCERFDLIFGTSTGAIIAALLALGYDVEKVHQLYKAHVPTVMQSRSPADKCRSLQKLADDIFSDTKFDAVKTGIGIVATKWVVEKPMVFKAHIGQAHGRIGTFAPGFELHYFRRCAGLVLRLSVLLAKSRSHSSRG